MDKIFIENKDYLPDGWTFEKIEKLLEAKKLKPLTKETLAEVVSEECLNMTEEDLMAYLAKYEDQKPLVPPHMSAYNPRMAYAEDLDKNDELNQDFPEPEDK